jgi:hypothetical protein
MNRWVWIWCGLVGCSGTPLTTIRQAVVIEEDADPAPDSGADSLDEPDPVEAEAGPMDAGTTDAGPWNPLGEPCNGGLIQADSCWKDIQQWAIDRNVAANWRPVCPPQDNLGQPTVWALSDAGYDNECLFYCTREVDSYCSSLFAGHCWYPIDGGQDSVCVP